jgi:nucleotide-binding universal stress UspA family protein
MKVLIAVDGSTGSFEAVRQIGKLVSADRDQVGLLYAPPPIKGDDERSEKTRQSLATAVFDEAKLLLPDWLRSRCEAIVAEQPAKQTILHTAETWHAELIALGARGLGPIQRLLLGSVSTSVVHTAAVPVYVARVQVADREKTPLRVLVACESAEHDKHLAEVLAQFSWPTGTTGMILSVVQSMSAGHLPTWVTEKARSAEIEEMGRVWMAEHAAEIDAKKLEMKQFAQSLPETFRGAEPLVMEGHAADRILETITAQKIDLVVVGAHSSSLTRLLLGSTSETVLSHAPCSVLVARQFG